MQDLINPKCFSQEWIISKSKQFSGDPILIEKTIRAFALLGFIAQFEEDFIFKGGTSLLLHVPKIKRLSIDIDIIYGDNIENFISKLSEIPESSDFIRFEENVRGHRGLPNRKHFKFYYNSVVFGKEESVLLDIVLEYPNYIPFIETKPIKTDLFEVISDLEVKLPSIEGLLGDKLTAFAPSTTGVPFITKGGNLMVMQVIKQLYDLGELFDIASDFEKVKIAFDATFNKENDYRGTEFTKEQALQDTIDTCLELLHIRLKGFKPNQITDYLEDGISKISNHLLKDRFIVEEKAKITASKVLYIANSIKNGIAINFSTDKYSEDKFSILEAITLQKPYQRLNRLKPILPEAFYYIWKAVKE
ncbi:MAG: nucleotidyl transferase AbiEii/AbiGii toxin family protein [Candidatus Delongbacteria bacterium]|nr:nucleotidyl transferase AbiEii/AbiGii toxin family protein [Candidatus Delongbacteria bacterium]